jgi:hypothetical protein
MDGYSSCDWRRKQVRRGLSILIVSVAASGIGLAAGGALAARPAVTVKCMSKWTNQTPGKFHGYSFGLNSCGTPLGNGLQYASYKFTVNAFGSVAIPGPGTFKDYYDAGTTHGSYQFDNGFNPRTDRSFMLRGSVKVLGGTGAYKNAAGSGTITCRTRDLGNHLRCTVTLSMNRL